MDGDTGLSTVGHKWVFGGDFNTGVSLLEFTFPLFCLPGPDQTHLPKVVHGKYVTETADQKYDFKTAAFLSASFSASSVWRQNKLQKLEDALF